MEIKYEPVFGDQALFDDDQSEAIVVVSFDDGAKVFIDAERYKIQSPLFGYNGSFSIAMRSIIKVPTWTVADKKAGKLPEVGCNILLGERPHAIKAISGCLMCVYDAADGDLDIAYVSDAKPIESPEEKAQRLEDEFINYVLHHEKSQINSSEELVAAKRAIKLAYKLQLSGELPMPGKE